MMVENNRITEFIEWILMYDPNLNTLLEERMDEEGVDFDLPESVKDLLYSILNWNRCEDEYDYYDEISYWCEHHQAEIMMRFKDYFDGIKSADILYDETESIFDLEVDISHLKGSRLYLRGAKKRFLELCQENGVVKL